MIKNDKKEVEKANCLFTAKTHFKLILDFPKSYKVMNNLAYICKR